MEKVEFKLTEELKKEVNSIVVAHESKESALLPVIHLLQKHFGYITPETEEWISGYLKIPAAHVHEVVSFYHLIHTKPVGKYHVTICSGLYCTLLEGDNLKNYMEDKLGIKVGEISSDGKFSLEVSECMGLCETAPGIRINEVYYEKLTKEKINEILLSLR